MLMCDSKRANVAVGASKTSRRKPTGVGLGGSAFQSKKVCSVIGGEDRTGDSFGVAAESDKVIDAASERAKCDRGNAKCMEGKRGSGELDVSARKKLLLLVAMRRRIQAREEVY